MVDAKKKAPETGPFLIDYAPCGLGSTPPEGSSFFLPEAPAVGTDDDGEPVKVGVAIVDVLAEAVD